MYTLLIQQSELQHLAKAKTAYTQAELLTLDDGGKQIGAHWADMFNKKYAYHISDKTAAAHNSRR